MKQHLDYTPNLTKCKQKLKIGLEKNKIIFFIKKKNKKMSKIKLKDVCFILNNKHILMIANNKLMILHSIIII